MSDRAFIVSIPRPAAQPIPDSVAGYQPMRIGVEVLGGEFKQLRVFDRFHLMHQSDRHVRAFARRQFELLDRGPGDTDRETSSWCRLTIHSELESQSIPRIAVSLLRGRVERSRPAIQDNSGETLRGRRDRRYLFMTEIGRLEHEEHGPIVLEAGWYKVRRKRGYDPIGTLSTG